MATLIIPDVHERLDRLERALVFARTMRDAVSRIVFLGDWFDAFGPVDLRKVGQICGWLNANINGVDGTPFVEMDATDGDHTITRVIPADFLLGNHDCHYFFHHNGFMCSGYDHRKKDVIQANLAQTTMDQFKVFTKVGPYLCSHAGLHLATLGFDKPEVEAGALRTARAGGWDPFWGAGRARGGNQQIGGPTWLDWGAEFEHIDDLPQIVGHTNGQHVRSKGNSGQLQSWCLDTALRNCAIVDEETGAIEIVTCS